MRRKRPAKYVADLYQFSLVPVILFLGSGRRDIIGDLFRVKSKKAKDFFFYLLKKQKQKQMFEKLRVRGDMAPLVLHNHNHTKVIDAFSPAVRYLAFHT